MNSNNKDRYTHENTRNKMNFLTRFVILHNYNRSDEASFCLQISKDMNVERCRSWEGMEHIINDLVIYNMTLVKTIVNTSVKVFSIVFWHRGEETKHRHVFYTFKGSR